MATLDITEYRELAFAGRGHIVMAGLEPCTKNQQVTIGAGSNQSQAFEDTTRFIRIHADAACRIAVGDDPTATSASMRMSAGGTEYLGVHPGLKLAVIAAT